MIQTIVHEAISEYPSFFLIEAATNGLGPSHPRFIVAQDEMTTPEAADTHSIQDKFIAPLR